MHDVETEDHYTVEQAAAYLGVTASAIHRAITAGLLPSVLQYGRRWVRKADAEAYKQRTQPGGKPGRGRPKGSKDREPRGRE